MNQNIKLCFHTNLDSINIITSSLNTNKSYLDVKTILGILEVELNKKRYNNHDTLLPFFDLNSSNALLKYNGKIVYNSDQIDLRNYEADFIELDVIFRLKGGIFSRILRGIKSFFDKILFNPILYPIRAVLRLIELVFWKIPMYLIKLFIWGVKFISWFLLEVCSPSKLVNDFGTVLTTLVFSIVFAVFDVMKYFIKKIVNMFGPTIFNGFWGWDQVQNSEFDRTEAAYFDPKHNRFNYKNYRTDENKIPMSIIIGTVIFPPLGVFMEYGLSGWIQILISGMLTLLFYFPGLVFSLMCLYC